MGFISNIELSLFLYLRGLCQSLFFKFSALKGFVLREKEIIFITRIKQSHSINKQKKLSKKSQEIKNLKITNCDISARILKPSRDVKKYNGNITWCNILLQC